MPCPSSQSLAGPAPYFILNQIRIRVLNFLSLFQAIKVIIEVGHKAFLKDKPDSKGHTHDWTVYVRASDNKSLDKLVSKVQFTLHETFKNPCRSEPFQD